MNSTEPTAAEIPDFSRGADGLLPAIAQDADSLQILMLAWMNEEAWRETMSTGRAVYFSRSRNRLWRKGETSGHVQQIQEVRVDCDADCILLFVKQEGAACHEGYRSCFFRKVTAGESGLAVETCDERMKDPKQIYGK